METGEKKAQSLSNDQTTLSLSISTTRYIKINAQLQISTLKNNFNVIWRDTSERSFEITQGWREKECIEKEDSFGLKTPG